MGAIMDNTMRGDAGASLSPGKESAVQNSPHDTSKLKLLLVWLAVGLPMIWGVIRTLEDGVDLMP
jgi:hypothetical protein